jgi:predicted 2-oxoglutarate/Fe(II)-dependent dioxygenase YbiX
VVQLSDPDDYEGGNLQLLDEAGNSYIAPRKRGTVILFDSRTQHRVLKVTKGTRKSLVGWCVGSPLEIETSVELTKKKIVISILNKTMESHYVYYSYEEFGRGYIGCRTCECLPRRRSIYGIFY